MIPAQKGRDPAADATDSGLHHSELKSLEEELGKKLFIRRSFSIRLTEEGALLRSRAEDLISMADKLEQEFISLDDINGGELYLGLAESYQIRYLARVIRDFKTRYPNLHYHITSGDTEQIADKLDKGLLDFLVLAELPDSRKYEYLAFPERDVWGLVIPKVDPLAERNVIRPEDLAGLPLFCSEQGWNGDINRWALVSVLTSGSLFTRSFIKWRFGSSSAIRSGQPQVFLPGQKKDRRSQKKPKNCHKKTGFPQQMPQAPGL